MLSRDEILSKIKTVLADSLAVDEDDIRPESTLTGELGAESIDFLDIGFRIDKAFGIKIQQGELFPENAAQDPTLVKDGKVTPEGLTRLKARLPHFDFTGFEKDPQLAKIAQIFTVDALVKFVEAKLAKQG